MCYEKRDTEQARACFERDQRKDDYISRKALLAEYDRVHVGPPGGARKLIEEATAADVAPVVHGRWYDVNSYEHGEKAIATCSHCRVRGAVRTKRTEYGFWVINSPVCPNCGARMDGE